MTDEDDARAVQADLLEEQGQIEQAAELRLDIATPDVRVALYALFARLETAETRDQRMSAMMRSVAASRRAKQRGWTELVGQTMHLIARSDDPISALVGLAMSADAKAVRDAATAWLADHGAREVRLRALAQLGRVPRNATCAVLEGTTTRGLHSLCIPDPGTHVWTSDISGTLSAIDLTTGNISVITQGDANVNVRPLVTAHGRVYAPEHDSHSGIVEEWNGTELVRRHEGHPSGIWEIATDGEHLVACSQSSNRPLSVWNLATGARTMVSSPVDTSALAVRGDRVWVGGADGEIRIFSIATGQLVDTIRWFDSRVTAIVIAGNEVFASASTTIRSTSRAFGATRASISGLAVTATHVISSGVDSVLRIWDRATGERLATVEGHSINEVIAHPDGQRVLSCGDDGTVRVVDLEHALEIDRNEISWQKIDWIVAVDADRMLVGGDDASGFTCHSVDSGVRWQQEAQCGPLHILGDLAVGGTSIVVDEPYVRSLVDGSVIRPLETTKKVGRTAIHAGDRRVVGGCGELIRVWSVDTGAVIRTLVGHTGLVQAVHRHPDGDRVVSSSSDRTFRVWSLTSGECLATFAYNGWELAIVGERVVAWSQSEAGGMWDLATGNELAVIETRAFAGARLPGTNRVVLGEARTGALVLFDVDRAEIVTRVEAHAADINHIEVTPTHVATTSDDRSLAIWTHDLQLHARWQGRTPGAIAWLSEKRIALAESHGEVVVLEI